MSINNKDYYNLKKNEINNQHDIIYNPNSFNGNINNFQKETLFNKTKNSVNDLINYNDEFQKSAQFAGEQIDEKKINQLLLPVYSKIYEIREDLQKFNELKQKSNKENISNREFNEMQSLHTNIVFNKNIIDDTINYMKEKIENIHYEQIHKEFEEITSILETLNIEMENMINEFNNKYEKIIKEKKRKKIAEDLLNGNYNKNPKINKYDLLNKKEDLVIHKNIDDEEDVDYHKYKNELDELNLNKENLMLKYLEDKQKAINGLPKLVPPNEKVSFKYQIKPPSYNIENSKNDIDKDININNNEKSNGNEINDNKIVLNDNINSINNVNNNLNDKMNEQSKENGREINNSSKNYNAFNSQKQNPKNLKKKKSVNFMEDDGDNNDIYKKKSNLDLTETLNDFQKKMNIMSNQIITGQPKKNFKPKIIKTGISKAEHLRNIRPRSNKSKVTLKDFNKIKKREPYIFDNKYNKKKNNFKSGIYPKENDGIKLNDFIKQHPQKPIPKREINPNLDPNSLEKEIQRIVELNLKKAFSLHKSESQKGNNTSDELIKILIQKFDDIENAIRETRNNNGVQFQQDINEMLANEIFLKIMSQMDRNININVNQSKKEEEKNQPMHEEIKSSKKEDEEEYPKNINVLENYNQVDLEELEEKIPNPRDILRNLDVGISNSNSFINESQISKNKNEIKKDNTNIEITNINIKDNRLFYENNNNNINNNHFRNDNSISNGEIRSENEESEEFENENNKKPYKTDNNFFNRNKTGKDLLLLKNYNENLPENYKLNNILNNINNIDNLENGDKNIFPKYNVNNFIKNIHNIENRPEINMDNSEELKKYGLYGSEEYNNFKNNFQEKMNNNKTQSNFGNISFPNNTYTQFRPIQNNNNFNNTFENLKLLKFNKYDNDEINKNLNVLREKNNLNSKPFEENDNGDNNIQFIKNLSNYNIKSDLINQNNNNIEYSEGEIPGDSRADDSY